MTETDRDLLTKDYGSCPVDDATPCYRLSSSSQDAIGTLDGKYIVPTGACSIDQLGRAVAVDHGNHNGAPLSTGRESATRPYTHTTAFARAFSGEGRSHACACTPSRQTRTLCMLFSQPLTRTTFCTCDRRRIGQRTLASSAFRRRHGKSRASFQKNNTMRYARFARHVSALSSSRPRIHHRRRRRRHHLPPIRQHPTCPHGESCSHRWAASRCSRCRPWRGSFSVIYVPSVSYDAHHRRRKHPEFDHDRRSETPLAKDLGRGSTRRTSNKKRPQPRIRLNRGRIRRRHRPDGGHRGSTDRSLVDRTQRCIPDGSARERDGRDRARRRPHDAAGGRRPHRVERPASGRCLNELYEMGIPTKRDESAWPEPLATFAARHWSNPAYVDILATLVEFGADFDATTKKHTTSGRELIESRAPGLFRLIEFKAHLVASGGAVNFPEFLM